MTKLFAFAFATLLATASLAEAPPAKVIPVEVKPSGKPGQVTATLRTRETAVIKAVDVATRSLTLETNGETQTIKVGPGVVRLKEFAVGDTISMEVEKGLALELQAAGAEHVEGSVITTADRSDKAQAPEAITTTTVNATVTVTAIDKAKRLITFQAPNGNVYKVKAGAKVKFDKLKVGDKLLGTYIEAVAIKLEKAKKKK